jgi:hypothetical protein
MAPPLPSSLFSLLPLPLLLMFHPELSSQPILASYHSPPSFFPSVPQRGQMRLVNWFLHCFSVQVLKGPCSDAFIVLFKAPQAATLAAHSSVFPQSGSRLDAFKVQAAPGPEEVLWQVGKAGGKGMRGDWGREQISRVQSGGQGEGSREEEGGG